MFRLEYIVEMDAESIAEIILADFLNKFLEVDRVPVNGVVSYGFSKQGEIPERPRIVVSADEGAEFQHEKVVSVSVAVDIETYALGFGDDRGMKHAGTDAYDVARWRSILRDLIHDGDKWSEYFTELKSVIGAELPRWVPSKYFLVSGAAEHDENTGECLAGSVVKMTMKAGAL